MLTLSTVSVLITHLFSWLVSVSVWSRDRFLSLYRLRQWLIFSLRC